MNETKTSPRRTLLAAALAVAVVSSALSLYLVTHGQDIPSSKQSQSGLALFSVQEDKVDLGLPVRLKIPAIDVDSSVEYVGLTPDGAMDVPKDPAKTAWFEPGTRPGEAGSAVIAGHFGWKDGKAAVFDNLSELSKGDEIFVEDDMGTIVTFVVREIRTYGENEDAPEVFGSSDGKAHLNLVTCKGVWNKSSKSYSKRLVVFADKVDATSSPQEIGQ